MKKALFGLCFLILPALFSVAQNTNPESASVGGAPVQSAPGFARLRRGLDFYQQGRWREAIAELRRAQGEAIDPELKAEALYWIALSEISTKDYTGAVQDMDRLELTAPESRRLQEIPYHKGRALYYLGRYEEALLLLKMYADSIGGIAPAGSDGAARKSAALYWIGECLYAMGQLDYSRDVFTIITQDYPRSAKFEASSYRLALIHQKKIEEELLNLLKWSHEESLKAIEEYQRRERSYDQALIAYQKRIAELLKDSRLEDLDSTNTNLRRQLNDAAERNRQLEEQLRGSRSPELNTSGNQRERLEGIKDSASDLADTLDWQLGGNSSSTGGY